MPEPNEKNIILNSHEKEICMIEIYDYKILKYCEMTDEIAIAEGESNLEEWKKIHKKFFSDELGIEEKDFNESTLIIYYLFKVLEKYI